MAFATFPLNTVRNACAALAAALLAWTAPAIAAPKVVGITSAVVNDVQVKPVATETYRKAKLRERVRLADRVRTGQRSRMQLVLLDKTRFSVGANAQLTINKFVYDPSGGAVSASVVKGAFRFMSGKSRRATKTVTTPSATIGIRGTVFDGAVGQLAVDIARRENSVPRGTRHDPQTATLIVLRGPGQNRQANLPVGLVEIAGIAEASLDAPVILDEPLKAAYVPYAGAAPIGPFSISLSGLGQLGDFILAPPTRNFRPFNASSLPFPPDRPRGPPPGAGYPGGDFPGGNPGNGVGSFPGSAGFPGGFDMPRNPGRDRPHNDVPSDPPRDPAQPGSNSPDPRQPSAIPPDTDQPAGVPLGTVPGTNEQPQSEQPPQGSVPGTYPNNNPNRHRNMTPRVYPDNPIGQNGMTREGYPAGDSPYNRREHAKDSYPNGEPTGNFPADE